MSNSARSDVRNYLNTMLAELMKLAEAQGMTLKIVVEDKDASTKH